MNTRAQAYTTDATVESDLVRPGRLPTWATVCFTGLAPNGATNLSAGYPQNQHGTVWSECVPTERLKQTPHYSRV